MTKDEALRLAEEAIMDELEAVTADEFEDAAGKLDNALRAIRKALEEPTIRENLTVEPVAWIDPKDLEVLLKLKENYQSDTICGYQMNKNASDPKDRGVPLYAAPVEPVNSEPVAYVSGYYNGRCIVKPIDEFTVFPVGRALYTAPQPRREVDLTDDEISDAIHGKGSPLRLHDCSIRDFRAVIAADREKNK